MKKMDREEIKKARAAQELAETATNNTGHDDTNQTQAEDLRAYAPASAAMAPSAPELGDDYFDHGDWDDMEDDDESGFGQVSQDMKLESKVKMLAKAEEEERRLLGKEIEEDAQSDEEDDGAEADTASDNAPSVNKTALSESFVDTVVDEINRIAKDTVEKGKLEIGEYVFQVAFKGEIRDVMSKNAYKTQTLKDISDHPRLGVDRRRVGSWVKAAAFKAELESELVGCDKLTVYKLTALLKLGDKYKAQRKELAVRANAEGLSVRDILDEVEKLKGAKKQDNAKGLLKKIAAPLALLADEKTKAELSDNAYLTEKLLPGNRLEMVNAIDEITAKLNESTSFLRSVQQNLIRITLAPHNPEA
jgi:hypothetical protein